MNGMKRSGKPGIVHAMQMPPTFGQPPTPFTQPRAGTLHFATGPAQPTLARHVPWSAERVCEAAVLGETRRGRTSRAPCARRARPGVPGRRARSEGPHPAISSAMRWSVSVIASGCTGQPGRLISGAPAPRDEAVAEMVAQPHRAGRVVAHRGHSAVRRARAERQHDRRARCEPVDPGGGRDRLAVVVDAEAGPVALAVDLLVRDRSPRRRGRTDPAPRARRHARPACSRRPTS